MADLVVRRAGADDRDVLERLWPLFLHDLSEFWGVLPNPDGTYRREWLESAIGDPTWLSYLIWSGDRPVGFAFVRALDSDTRVLNSFFVVRGARRSGLGLRAVQSVLAAHPGRWEIAFQEENEGAARFWRRVASEVAGETWTEERRPVSRKSELSTNTWVAFDAR
ncbi:GNAT family N-acetyltransferase (plasmid) [Streptomyces sp. NBC_00178]|uniref:GNAT family N-acetyltransferase n=1 Tax=Streptomyces sp. NBC_00178 TaxID=2975672 RepID=UPI002E2BDB97|nr:GNAT family N-acetyltransferase [Streptomyces sp. NBC_00178]